VSDVVVVGGGNAGLSAAISAAEAGARVTLIEKASPDWAGGNSYFTAGAFRTTFGGLADLQPLVTGLRADQAALTDLPPYTASDFLADFARITHGRADPELTKLIVGGARSAVDWLARHKVAFELMYHRQAYQVDGRFRFWGGLAVGSVGGGKGLIEAELAAARAAGVEVRFATAARQLSRARDGAVTGITAAAPDGIAELPARAVILCCGGFEANPQLRAAYLGPGWDLAVVRGTPHNTGDGISMALAAGAQPFGHWSGCHAVAWDAGAGAFGNRELTNQLTRNGYPLGIVINAAGERFLDEGADFRNYTYARYGAEILRQPGGAAFQIFDARTVPLLRAEEYGNAGTTKAVADTLPELAKAIGVPEDALLRTVTEFNAAVSDGPFDPAIRDGKTAAEVSPPKSNWSLPLDRPPFAAFPVTCGVTFTFGGLRVDGSARVLDTAGRPIQGLYAAGEIVGGIFYHNYPGGSGLTAGTVLGRLAGRQAAADGQPPSQI
jgi:tricarballylate dehydrogenase